MKNILLSLSVLVVLIGGGYYLLSGNESNTEEENLLGYNNGEVSTTTDLFGSNGTSSSTAGTSTNAPQEIINKKSHMITIETNFGTIVFETYNSDAPNTVNNFVTLANKGYYDGLIFHRVIKNFMIQGGDPNGTGTGGPGYKFNDELDPNTPSYKAGYKRGVVAMANAGPNTNGSQFFIMHQDYPLPNSYTIFGKVVSGIEIVDKIANVQTGAQDRPVSPVIMTKVTVN